MRLIPLLHVIPCLAWWLAPTPCQGAHLAAAGLLVVDGVAGSPVHGSVAAPAALRGPLAYGLTRPPRHGSVILGEPDARGGRHWVYRPDPGYVGTDRFELVASDTLHTAAIGVAVAIAPAPAQARRQFYVDARRGNDRNPGTRQRPFATLQAAHDVTLPGDTVFAMAGRYVDAAGRNAILHITRSGLPGAKITYRAYPGQRAVLTAASAWNHITVQASHIRIEGFDIAGTAAAIALADAQAVYGRFAAGPGQRSWGPETSRVNTNGISVRAGAGEAALPPRHVEIVGNHVHDVPGGGIVSDQADYVLIAGNRVHDNARRAIFANGGILLRQGRNTDQASPPYRNIVCNNTVYRNEAVLPWYVTQAITGGHGILVDHVPGAAGPPGRQRTLVTGNVVYHNSGTGIAANRNSGVDVLRNTSYGNGYGEIAAAPAPADAPTVTPACPAAQWRP